MGVGKARKPRFLGMTKGKSPKWLIERWLDWPNPGREENQAWSAAARLVFRSVLRRRASAFLPSSSLHWRSTSRSASRLASSANRPASVRTAYFARLSTGSGSRRTRPSRSSWSSPRVRTALAQSPSSSTVPRLRHHAHRCRADRSRLLRSRDRPAPAPRAGAWRRSSSSRTARSQADRASCSNAPRRGLVGPSSILTELCASAPLWSRNGRHHQAF